MIIVFLALLLRLVLIPNPGFEADISFWKSWGLGVVDFGLIKGIAVTNNNYPIPFAYVLGLMVGIYKLFADPHNFNQFWSNTNVLFLAVSKAFPILADFGIAGIILWFGRNTKRIGLPDMHPPFYFLLTTYYLLNPISIIDGALWGQVDSLGVFIFLLAVVFAVKKKPMLAGAIFICAMMTKLQNMIYGPLFFLFLWKYMGFDGLMRAIIGATVTFFGLNIEFLLARNMSRVIASLTENYDYFPLMSLNAFNLWWIVAKAHGMEVSDKLLAIGIANAKTVGLFLFSSSYLFAVLRQVFPRDLLRNFFEGLIIINASFFLFQTQSHDRYAFPLSVFLLLWFPFSKIRIPLFFILYTLFSIFYFYNLHTALIFNYPLNGFPFLSTLTNPIYTLFTSVVLIGLFIVFLFFIARRSHWIVSMIPIIVFAILLTAKNLPLIQKKPVSLTKLTPYVSEQEYGRPVMNMPVGAQFAIHKQSFLSDQYAFYRTGIGTHARSFFNYDIGGHFRRFTTDYGIDTEAGDKGTVIFEIYGDGNLLHRSPVQGRFTLPGHADVDITGIKILGLIVTDSGDGNNDDHADWLMPTLWP